MPHTVPASAALILVGSLLWTGRLLFGSSPWGTQGAALLAVGLLLATAVNVVAMLLQPGRWVRNSITVIGSGWAVPAILLPADPLWVAAFVTHLIGVAMAWTRLLDGWFRQVKPDRVPARATSLAIGLVWLPAVVGGLGIPDVTAAGWVMAAFGLLGGWAYARALPGALWAVRVVLLPLGIVSVVGLRLAAAAAVLAVASALTLLAWSSDARLAVRPPVPRQASPVSILPEVTPPSVMESAGYDRRGRPLKRSD